MWTNHKKEFVWGFGLFTLIFFSTSQIFNLVGNYTDHIPVSRVATVFNLFGFGNKNLEEGVVAEELEVFKPKKENIRLAFVGDIMLDRGVKSYVYKYFVGDYSQLFVKVKKQLQSYDILFANLEGPISDKGKDEGGEYSFRMEPKTILALKDAGFDIFSVANNHVFNWGQSAFTETLQLLTEAGINYVGGGEKGSEAYQAKVVDVQGVQIAFLAFGEFKAGGVMSSSTRPGIAVISEVEIKESVSKAKLNADLVVVSYHFGEEYQEQPNNYQRKYSELSIDSGADLVIGHHSHVVQTLEKYKNTYIIYSLGNFIFDQYFSEETMQGGLLEVEVGIESKQIEKAELKQVFLNKMYQVEEIK